jgi:hypothetical protein
MKDSSGNDVDLPDISGETKQDLALAGLCLHCKGLLQRVLDLEGGLEQYPDRVMGPGRAVQPPSSLPGRTEPDQRFEDSEPFQSMAEDNSMPHKSCRDELRESSDRGCLMCKWFFQSLQSSSERTSSTIIEQWLKRPATVEMDPMRSPLGDRCQDHYILTLRCPAPPAPPEPPINMPLRPEDRIAFNSWNAAKSNSRAPWPNQQLRGDEVAILIVDVIPESSHSKKLLSATKNLMPMTPSAATMDLITTWRQICHEEHSKCKRDTADVESRVGPSRLLDLQTEDVVRLVAIEPPDGEPGFDFPKYAALSHCWGFTHKPQLNKDTIDALMMGMPVQDLPTLYRDAVLLSRRLGIPYLWIDSLCIMQDAKEDWHHESTKMGDIYMNCDICIAATAAESNDGSLLEVHSADWPQPLVYGNLVIQACVKMKETNMNMRQPGWCDRMRTLSQWAVDQAPLNQRAWVLQERTLAPRILHCTADEFVWECCVGMRSESHPVLTAGGSVVKDVWNEIYRAPQHLRDPSTFHLYIENRRRLLHRWSETIGIYSNAKITFAEDRLPACSAIAQQMEPILGKYIAGLWERFLPSQLLWYHHPICRVPSREKHHMRKNRCPTWSWASLDCRASLPSYYSRPMGGFSSAEQSRGREIDFSELILIQMLETEVSLGGKDTTGAVNGGQIRLAGRIFPVYQSAAFGYLLNPEPLSANLNDSYEPVKWYLDDKDAEAYGDQSMIREALKPGE